MKKSGRAAPLDCDSDVGPEQASGSTSTHGGLSLTLVLVPSVAAWYELIRVCRRSLFAANFCVQECCRAAGSFEVGIGKESTAECVEKLSIRFAWVVRKPVFV